MCVEYLRHYGNGGAVGERVNESVEWKLIIRKGVLPF